MFLQYHLSKGSFERRFVQSLARILNAKPSAGFRVIHTNSQYLSAVLLYETVGYTVNDTIRYDIYKRIECWDAGSWGLDSSNEEFVRKYFFVEGGRFPR